MYVSTLSIFPCTVVHTPCGRSYWATCYDQCFVQERFTPVSLLICIYIKKCYDASKDVHVWNKFVCAVISSIGSTGSHKRKITSMRRWQRWILRRHLGLGQMGTHFGRAHQRRRWGHQECGWRLQRLRPGAWIMLWALYFSCVPNWNWLCLLAPILTNSCCHHVNCNESW